MKGMFKTIEKRRGEGLSFVAYAIMLAGKAGARWA